MLCSGSKIGFSPAVYKSWCRFHWWALRLVRVHPESVTEIHHHTRRLRCGGLMSTKPAGLLHFLIKRLKKKKIFLVFVCGEQCVFTNSLI